MKVRWTRHSIRFRITPSEMEGLLTGREVVEVLVFPGGQWSVTLKAGEKTALGMVQGSLHLTLSAADRECLAAPDAEGIYFEREAGEGATTTAAASPLRYYVEKDFPCAHPRPPAAQEPVTETFAPPPGFKERHRTC